MKVKEKPLLSVIIPVYGVEKYISECLESIINQTYKNLEIIVINDGTKDNSSFIAKQYADKDKRIHVYDFENGGISVARNRGVELATGKYIAFVDSDDKIHPNMYTDMINKLEEHSLDLIKCGIIEFGNKIKKIISFNEEEYFDGKNKIFNKYFDGLLWVVVWNAVYKASIVKKVLFPKNVIHEDNYSAGMYLFFSEKVGCINKNYYYYRYNANGITNGKNTRPLDKYISIKKLCDDLSAHRFNNMKLYLLLAIEVYHFIRLNDRRFKVKSINKSLYKFVISNLNFRRKILFYYYIYKKNIEIRL